MASFGLVRNVTDNTSDLDRLIQSYECENQQYVKSIEKENQVINVLEKDLEEKQAEIIQLQSAISKLDEDTKFFHRQFKQNRENCESLKQTRTLLQEHEQVLQKKLQTVYEHGHLERSERDGILQHYRNIWQDYEAKYKSLPLARKLLILQDQAREKELNLKAQKEKLGQLKDQFSSLKDAEELADLHIFIIKLATLKTESNTVLEEVRKVERKKENVQCLIKELMKRKQAQEQRVQPYQVLHSDDTVKNSEVDVEVEQRMESDQELISFNFVCSPIINSECSESEDGSKAMQTGDSSTVTNCTQDADVPTHMIAVADGHLYQDHGSQVEVPASEAELNVVKNTAAVESHTATTISSENKFLKQPCLIITPQISRLIQPSTPTLKTGSASPQHGQMPETPRVIPHVYPSPKPTPVVHPPSRIPIIPQKPTSKFLQFQSAVRSIAPPVSPCMPRNAAAKQRSQPPARTSVQPNMPSSNTADSNQAFKRNESHGNKSPAGAAQRPVSKPIVPPSPIIPPVFYNSYIKIPPSPSVPQIASLSSLQTNGSQSQHQQIKKFVTQPATPKPCQITVPVQTKPIISPPEEKSHEHNVSTSSEDLQMQQTPKTPEHQRVESLMDISSDDSNSPFSFEKHKQKLYQMYRSPGCDLYKEQRFMFSSHEQTSNDEKTEQESGVFETLESLLSTGVPFELLGSPGSLKVSSDLPKNVSPVKTTSAMPMNVFGGARVSSPTSSETNQHITFKFGGDNRDGSNSRGNSSLQSLFGGGGDADPATHNKNCGFSFTFGSSEQDNDLPRQGSSILSLFGSGSGASKAQDIPNVSGFSFNFGASDDKDEDLSPTFRLF